MKGFMHRFAIVLFIVGVASGLARADQNGGLRITPWARNAEGLEKTRQALLPLLDLPIEVVLPAHGSPVLSNGRDALARALEP